MEELVILKEPGVDEALQKLNELLGRRAWILLWASCDAFYEGRGASQAGEGDVMVIIKEDRSLIVHGPKGFKPMNWQPASSAISTSLDDEALVLRALRRSPRELLVLRCGRVYMLAGLVGARPPSFYMYLNESQIRDVLASNPDLIEDGLRIVGIERPVNPGFVDMYGYDRNGRLVVFEIKRVKAGEEAARQLLRYIEALRSRGVRNLRGVLLAPDFTESAIRLLEVSGLEYKRIDLRALYEMFTAKSQARQSRGGLLGYLRDSKE